MNLDMLDSLFRFAVFASHSFLSIWLKRQDCRLFNFGQPACQFSRLFLAADVFLLH